MDCKDPPTSTKVHFVNSNEKRSSFVPVDQTCDNDIDYIDTPYRNYMSYSGEECTDHFTPHQMARMHCYVDLMYRSWQPSKSDETRIGVIPLPPRITSASSTSVTLAWMPPLGYRGCIPSGSIGGQATCTDEGRLVQYAYKAHSAAPLKTSGYWAPHQAVGPPDSEPCEASTKAWLPDATTCDDPADCKLTLEFELATVVESLSLWSAWNAADEIRQLLLHFTDGSIESVHPQAIYCDVPFTTMITSQKMLKKIDVYTASPFISIDAVEIISGPRSEFCRQCDQLTYRVFRNPTYQTNLPYKETKERVLVDDFLQPDEKYQYRVQAINGTNVAADFSPAVKYYSGLTFCGDGKVESSANEECDDGNVKDGDGCSSTCKTEKHFSCKGSPSLCYVYIGDGVCERFEEAESVDDCGYHTPSGFVDQWPIEVVSNAPFDPDPSCNASVLVGPPRNHICGSSPDRESTWRVCGTNYWRDSKIPVRLKATFENAVVATSVLIHLASDGVSDFGSSESNFLRLELIGENNRTSHVRGSESIPVSCRRKNGVVEYSIWHDLSKPFFYARTILVHMESISQRQLVLAGLRLRSRRDLDPAVVRQCAASSTLYSPELNQCLDNRCVRPQCPNLDSDKTARAKCSGRNNGDTCTIDCEQGHYLVKEGDRKLLHGREDVFAFSNQATKVVCLNGQWSSRKVECRPMDCGLPKVARARVECTNGTTYGKRCTFYCLSPATTKGADNSVTCGKNGVWTVPEAYCQLSCHAPSDSDTHSKAINKLCRVHYKSLEAGSVTFPVGAKCKFMCKVGYHVDGQSLNKRLFRRICVENGQWTGPACVRVQCPEPKVIYAGIYNCTKGFEVGSECSFYCPGTKEVRVSTCVSDGKWTMTEPCALPKGTCLPPSTIRDIFFECAKKPFVGSICKVSCQAYGYDPVLEHIVVTESNFKMQVLQKVNHTTCSVQKSWEPDVRSLVCVKKCAQDFVGDGWCDFQNNRGYCAWDGGDCCASTAKGGKVKLMFPSLCTSHLCQCLDPYAIENRNDLERAKLLSTDFNLAPRSSRREQIKEITSVASKAGIDFLKSHGKLSIYANQSITNAGSIEKSKSDLVADQQISNRYPNDQSMRPRSIALSPWELSRLNVLESGHALISDGNPTYEELFMKPNEFGNRLETLTSALRKYKMLMAENRRGEKRLYVGKMRSLQLMALRSQYKNLQVES